MGKKLICKILIIISLILGIGSTLASAVLFIIGNDFYGTLGALSTIISIILGVVSILYSYISGKHTENTLAEANEKLQAIKQQNEIFIDNLRTELMKNNYGKENIENIRNKINK